MAKNSRRLPRSPAFRFARIFAALALLSVTASACTRPATRDEAVGPSTQVVVFALDAGTWDLLDPMIERGLLPNLARLKAEGVSGPLTTISPSDSPVIWTSVATGKTPEKHGITSFVRFPEDDPGKPVPVDRTMRRGKALWNILSDTGRDVAVVGWFVTWPPENVRGTIVSDHAHYGNPEKTIFPSGYLSGVPLTTGAQVRNAMPSFMSFDYEPKKVEAQSEDPEARLNYLVFDRFVGAYKRDDYYRRAALAILQERLPNFLAVYLRGTDDVQHGFWKFMDPEGFDDVTAEQADRFGRIIEEYWKWTDGVVGEVLEYYADVEPLVLVVSDHGAGPAIGNFEIRSPAYFHLSGSHRDLGIFIANGPGVRRAATIEDADIHDVTPTVLSYLGEPVARDMDGKVLGELFVNEIKNRPVEFIDTYDVSPAEDRNSAVAPEISKNDPEILEHLKSLGYIE